MKSLYDLIMCFVIFDRITKLLHMSCGHRYILETTISYIFQGYTHISEVHLKSTSHL
jgi:hypothetical protein